MSEIERAKSGFLKGAMQSAANNLIVGLSNGVSAIQTLVGLEPAARALDETEIAELRKVYADTVDYAQISLKEGFIGANQMLAPHTVGNTIYIPQGWLDPNSPDYARQRSELLVHETAHVWQFQNGGANYITESLYCQAAGALSGASRNAAYDFAEPIKDGKAWAELNPEQQAHLIEIAYAQNLFEDTCARLVYRAEDFTDFARDAIKQMRNRQGAP